MCGQFAVLGSVKAIKDYYEFLKSSGFILDDDFYDYQFSGKINIPNENIKPMDYLPIITSKNGKIALMEARWGLVPFWAKDTQIAYKTINARIETLAEKPSYKYAFRERRCLIPATGFYEKDTQKQSHYFDMGDDESAGSKPFKSMAGLYEIWGKDMLVTFTIVTTSADERVKKIHDRMPVILNEVEAVRWLTNIS